MRPSREIPEEQQIFRPITREKGSRSSDLELEQLIIAMALTDIKEMKETVEADCETFRKEVHEIWFHLYEGKEESEALERELGSSFKRLKTMFFEDRPKKPRNFLPSVECLEIAKLDQEVIARWESRAERKEKEGSYHLGRTLYYTPLGKATYLQAVVLAGSSKRGACNRCLDECLTK